MRVALIPPIPDLPHYTTDLHLLLSHLCESSVYLNHYRRCKARGDYIILDNSAHEYGEGNSADELLSQALIVKANEIVCSDVLFDARGTAQRTEAMLRYIVGAGSAAYVACGKPRLMLVPQGTDEVSWVRCLRSLLDLWRTYMGNTTPPVIGISKDYDDSINGGITRLIVRYCLPYRRKGIDVHCLGWPANLWSLATVAKRAPWVRSADSAKPFVYAHAGIRLEPGGPVPSYPHRQDHYFETSLRRNAYAAHIACCNVEVFKAAAKNKLIL